MSLVDAKVEAEIRDSRGALYLVLNDDRVVGVDGNVIITVEQLRERLMVSKEAVTEKAAAADAAVANLEAFKPAP